MNLPNLMKVTWKERVWDDREKSKWNTNYQRRKHKNSLY